MDFLSGLGNYVVHLGAPESVHHALLGVVALSVFSVLFISWLVLRASHMVEGENLKHLPLPPNDTPWAIPFLTDDTLKFLSGKVNDLALQRYNKYGGKPVRGSLLGGQVVHVFNHQHIRKLLSAEHDSMEVNFPPSVIELLGFNALSASKFDVHTKLRRILTPSFTAKAMEQYLPQLQRIVEEYVERWAEQKQVEMVNESRGLTYLVMVCVMMGFDDWLEDERFIASRDLFNTWLKGLFQPAIRIPGTPFYKALQARQKLMELINGSLEAKMRSIRQGDGAHTTSADGGSTVLLDRAIMATDEDGTQLNQQQLADIVVNLLFAGHDTSASTLMYMLWKLSSSHPEVVEKLQKEQNEIVQQFGDTISGDAIRAMKYTTAIVNEALRVMPIVPFIPREALKTIQLDGYRIPKGSTLWLHTGVVTSQCCAAGDPEYPMGEFMPERWLKEDSVRQTQWLPFGGGPRMCLGYPLALHEMKIVLAVLARKVQWKTPGADMPWEKFPILRPMGDAMMVDIAAL